MAPRTSPPDARDEIVEVLRRYEAAFNENDATGMNSLFTGDAIFVNFGGNLVFGAEDLLRAQTFVFSPGGPLEDVKVRYPVESLVFLADDIAVVHARQQTLGADDEATVGDRDPMEAVFMAVLVHDSTGWRIRVGQNTPVQ
jgi:uncharacterized protein (TIGR02246 family)